MKKKQDNTPTKKIKFKVKKGDYVEVISGNHRGEKGKILKVMPKKHKVIVEGVNYIFRHVKKSQKNPQGGRIQKEAPLHISNVKLYNPDSDVEKKDE